MAKERSVDSITVAIIAATFLVTLFLLIQSGVLGGDEPKIAILDTGMLLDDIHVEAGGEELAILKAKIDMKAQALSEQGYIVLRSEIVRSAPSEFYHSID